MLALVFLADFAGRRAVERALEEEARITLLEQAREARDRLAAGVPAAELAEVTRRRGGDRLTVIAADGTVIADSESDPRRMENHATRPEVAAVLAGAESATDHRHSASTGDDYLYLALAPAPGAPGLVRVARHLRALTTVGREANGRLRLTLLGAFGIALLLALLFSLPLARALAGLRTAADAIGAGRFDPPLPEGGGREVQAVADALHGMAARLQDALAARDKTAGERRALLDALADAAIGLDAAGRVVYANPAAEALHRRLALPAPAPGAAYGGLFPHPALQALLREPPAPRRLRLERAVAPEFNLEAVTAPAGDGGRLLLLNDLAEAERLQRIKQDLTANVSHELKTPLAAILGALETLEDEALSPDERKQFLAMALRHSRRLRDLLGDLLSLSRLERPDLQLKLEAFPADELAAGEVAALAQLAEQAGVTIRVEAAGELRGDRGQLAQALNNFMTNALRHAPRGGTVEVTAGRTPAGAGRIAVRDRGPSVPPEIRERIFERFFRGDSARDRESGGTGLGLAIVKHVAQLHGGRAWVEDAEGGGARFVLEWPMGEVASRE